MIRHILKKDFRLLWHFAAGVAALGWLFTLLVYRIDHGAPNLRPLAGMVSMLQVLASGILAATVVQLDALPGVRQDWLVRPIRRRDLLLAKLLFVVALVQAPIFVGDLAAALADGFPLVQALTAALLRSACVFAAFFLPVMAFGSIARNFTETIVGVVAAIVITAVVLQAMNMLFPSHWRFAMITGSGWIAELEMISIAVLGGVAVLRLQYFRRRTLAARWLTAGVGVVCLLVGFSPWQPVFAIQQRFSPSPGAAAGVQLEFQPNRERLHEPWRAYKGEPSDTHRPGMVISLPIVVSGLTEDTMLRTDRLEARLIGAGGRVEDLGLTMSPLAYSENTGKTYWRIYVRDAMYDQVWNRPIRLDLEFSLTFLRLHEAHAIPAVDGNQTTGALGRCRTSVNRSGTDVQLRCLKAGAPPPCTIFFLEHPASGSRNPGVFQCLGEYTPFFLQMTPDALSRSEVNLPFRDPAGQWHAPVDEEKLRGSRAVIRSYQPEAHFVRNMVIPEIRLQDWLSR